ncbi:6-carboxytetrahydropterin synthase [Chloracidobacterium sp. E]|nr:6-carboxytetrahydropterin synthase [Chloracidobacterium sp. E]
MPCATTGTGRIRTRTQLADSGVCPGEKLDENHILVDFRAVREATEEVMRYLDHKHLNELPPLTRNSTLRRKTLPPSCFTRSPIASTRRTIR